jgi:hypothetical protein
MPVYACVEYSNPFVPSPRGLVVTVLVPNCLKNVLCPIPARILVESKIDEETLSHISLLLFKHVLPNGTYFIKAL